MKSGCINALTVDVEDYFQVSALAPHIRRSEWDSIPCRVERNVDRILKLFAENHARATFFTLGWIAERFPQVVRNIVSQGHEIASHGYGHERASDLDRSEFSQDIVRAKSILEDISGKAIVGYRAPSFSIGEGNLWAFECLEKAGYQYSSSVYPVRHDHYGMPSAPRFAHRRGAGLVEFPVTTVRLFSNNFPAGGGGYFRFLPYRLSRWAIRRVNEADQESSIFYFHPWELDPDQPRITGVGLKTRFRHYINLHQTENRMRRLLKDFRWGPMNEVFKEQLA